MLRSVKRGMTPQQLIKKYERKVRKMGKVNMDPDAARRRCSGFCRRR